MRTTGRAGCISAQFSSNSDSICAEKISIVPSTAPDTGA